jgi:long-chain acyl-CoA synthetase
MAAHSTQSQDTDAAGKATVLDFFLENVEQHGGALAAMAKREGRYQNFTWGDMGADAKKYALSLVAAGVKPGQHVALMANTRYEWCTIDMGILWSGAVVVPIYPSSLPRG